MSKAPKHAEASAALPTHAQPHKALSKLWSKSVYRPAYTDTDARREQYGTHNAATKADEAPAAPTTPPNRKRKMAAECRHPAHKREVGSSGASPSLHPHRADRIDYAALAEQGRIAHPYQRCSEPTVSHRLPRRSRRSIVTICIIPPPASSQPTP
ncbi:hypothetical protein FOA52_004438 [Chlamydomonas sp. UWO 241]|nr:hypothetical protein FOA52_004438 [Chlamydomonas sp. UWO 241]